MEYTRPATWADFKTIVALACLAAAGCSNAAPPASATPATSAVESPREGLQGNGCLAAGDGYLRARLRGALQLELDWRDAQMKCEGGPRPQDSGLRVSIAGPDRGNDRRLRFVFGLSGVREGAAASAVPTNVTVIFEGEQRVFATLGDDKCTVDSLQQERIGALGGPKRSYRVTARGFCTAPATNLSGDERIMVERFDFAGRIDIEDEKPHDPAQNR